MVKKIKTIGICGGCLHIFSWRLELNVFIDWLAFGKVFYIVAMTMETYIGIGYGLALYAYTI